MITLAPVVVRWAAQALIASESLHENAQAALAEAKRSARRVRDGASKAPAIGRCFPVAKEAAPFVSHALVMHQTIVNQEAR